MGEVLSWQGVRITDLPLVQSQPNLRSSFIARPPHHAPCTRAPPPPEALRPYPHRRDRAPHRAQRFGDPLHVVVIIIAALATIPYTRWMRPPLQMLQIADALGLAFFSIAGAQVAINAGHGGLIAVIMATITGSFGGLLRDVLCNEIPMILRKGQLYGVAAIAGASIYVLALELGLSRWPATVTGMLVIAAFRFGAIVWNWSLPVYSLPDAQDRSRD